MINERNKKLIDELIEEIEEIEESNKNINNLELVPLEQFKIVFLHEFFDKKGERHLLNEPLVVCCTSMRSNYSSVGWILNDLLDKMRFEVLNRYARVSETE